MAKSKWRAIARLNTAAVVHWTRKNLFRCDPYLIWADAVTTKWPKNAKRKDKLEIAVLVELKKAADYEGFLKRMNAGATDPDHLRFLFNGFEPLSGSRFITGSVNRAGLRALIREVLTQRIDRFSLQDAREDIARTARIAYTKALDVFTKGRPLQQIAKSPARPGTYLGIIDDGLPILRVRQSVAPLLDPPAHLWDQGWQPMDLVGSQVDPGQPPLPNDPHWEIAWEALASPTVPTLPGLPGFVLFLLSFRGFFYGRRLKSLSAAGAAGPANDRDEYAETGYFSPAPRQTHGARVLALMAPWLSTAKGLHDWPKYISGLAMVQLPTTTVLDTSGGSLAMRVLDGLRFILWKEQIDRGTGGQARPIVANVSYGTNAGPHDGTSMFERALEEMLDAHKNLHVVLPVGNAAQAGCHARRLLSAKGKARDSATMTLQVLPDNGRDTFVEIWIPKGGEVVLSIRPPGSGEEFKIREGEAKIHFIPDPRNPKTPHQVHFGAVYAKDVAQGKEGGMVLLAIGSTRALRRDTEVLRALNQQRRREVLGTPGLWELTVRNLGNHDVTVDAWVERDDAPPDVPSGSRQAYFPDSCSEEVRLRNATPEDTLNGIATLHHKQLHVIGAMRADGPLSDYTAAGPARPPSSRDGPDIVAPADWSRNVPGLLTMGFLHGVVTRINGTSAACAVYARALASKLGNGNEPPGSKAADAPPEITCVTDSQPEADPKLRGQGKRWKFPFEIDL